MCVQFTGARCETPIALAFQGECQCQNGGSCVPNTNECICQNGYEGSSCEIESKSDCVDGNCACATNPCPADSVCSPKAGSATEYECICNPGYSGENCDDIDECTNKEICGFGICLNKPGSYECFCRPGYTGLNCQSDVDECLSTPCKNGATCFDRVNAFECRCAPGYTGKQCEEDIDECKPNPCSKGSTCIDLVANCKCNKLYC